MVLIWEGLVRYGSSKIMYTLDGLTIMTFLQMMYPNNFPNEVIIWHLDELSDMLNSLHIYNMARKCSIWYVMNPKIDQSYRYISRKLWIKSWKTLISILKKVVGTLVKPKGMTLYGNDLHFLVNVVFNWSSVWIYILLYLEK